MYTLLDNSTLYTSSEVDDLLDDINETIETNRSCQIFVFSSASALPSTNSDDTSTPTISSNQLAYCISEKTWYKATVSSNSITWSAYSLSDVSTADLANTVATSLTSSQMYVIGVTGDDLTTLKYTSGVTVENGTLYATTVTAETFDGTATNVQTDANTSNELYLVGVTTDDTTDLQRDTAVTVTGGTLNALAANISSVIASTISATTVNATFVGDLQGTAEYAQTDLNNTDSLALVGVTTDDTTDLQRNTAVIVTGGRLTATSATIDSVTTTTLTATNVNATNIKGTLTGTASNVQTDENTTSLLSIVGVSTSDETDLQRDTDITVKDGTLNATTLNATTLNATTIDATSGKLTVADATITDLAATDISTTTLSADTIAASNSVTVGGTITAGGTVTAPLFNGTATNVQTDADTNKLTVVGVRDDDTTDLKRDTSVTVEDGTLTAVDLVADSISIEIANAEMYNGDLTGTASNVQTDANTSDTLYVVGVTEANTTDLQRDTSVTVQDSTVTAETFAGEATNVTVRPAFSTGLTLSLVGVTDDQSNELYSNTSVTFDDATITAETFQGDLTGTATNVQTDANTSDTLYVVGVTETNTTDLQRDTSVTVQGDTVTATTFDGNATTATGLYSPAGEYNNPVYFNNDGLATVCFTDYRNTFLGINSGNGNNNSSAVQNTAVGNSSLATNSGSNNSALGTDTLKSNTSGANNVAIGVGSLSSNTSGSNNSGIGYGALTSNDSGGNNTAIGNSAMASNISGSGNTAIGDSALVANTTGNYLVAIGVNAHATSQDISNNVAIGHGALQYNTAANNIAIGYSALNKNETGIDNVAIGYSSLTECTSGNDNTSIGFRTLAAVETGSSNTAIGSNALRFNEGSSNVAVGFQALYSNTEGNSNVAIGTNTLASVTTTSGNVAIGTSALNKVTTTGNVAVGYNSLSSATTAASNTAVGSNSMLGTTTGSNNVAMGNGALKTNTTGSSNIAVGLNTLVSNISGASNVAVGFQALYSNTEGANNVAIGSQTLTSNTDGSRNVAIGYQALSEDNCSGSIAIGSEAVYSSSGTLASMYASLHVTDDCAKNYQISLGMMHGLYFPPGTTYAEIFAAISQLLPALGVDSANYMYNGLTTCIGNFGTNAIIALCNTGSCIARLYYHINEEGTVSTVWSETWTSDSTVKLTDAVRIFFPSVPSLY